MNIADRLLELVGITNTQSGPAPLGSERLVPGWKYFKDPDDTGNHYPPETSVDLKTVPCPPYPILDQDELLDAKMDVIYKTYENTSIERKYFAGYPFRLYIYAARLFGPLPASQFDHDSYAGGLFAHSADVALKAVQLLDGTNLERNPIADHAEYDRIYWPITVIFAALFHDIGKIVTDIRVYHPDIEGLISSAELTNEFIGLNHSRIWFPNQVSIFDWLRRFPEGHRHCNILWRADRHHQHDRVRESWLRKMLDVTRMIDFNPKYWEPLFDPNSETGQTIWDLVHQADRASAESFHLYSPRRPELVVKHVLTETVRAGDLRIGIDFARHRSGSKILLKYPDDLLTLFKHLRKHPEFSVLQFDSTEHLDSISSKLAFLLRAAKVVETKSDGSPYSRHPQYGATVTLTEAFSSHLDGFAPVEVPKDLGGVGDPVPTVPIQSVTSQSRQNSTGPENRDPRRPPPARANPQNLNHASGAATVAAPPVLLTSDRVQLAVPTDVLPPVLCLFLEYLAEQCLSKRPPELTLAEWNQLETIERPKMGLFVHTGVALYVERCVIQAFTKRRHVPLRRFITALHDVSSVVSDSQQADDPRKLTELIVLTRQASGGVLENRLADFYSFIHRSESAAEEPLRNAELTGFARDIVAFAHTNERSGEDFFAPYSLDESQGLLSNNLLRWVLNYEDGIFTRTYGLTRSNLPRKLAEHGLEGEKCERGLILPYRLSDYYMEIQTHGK